MYRDKRLQRLMDMYAIMESASSCEFNITKAPPQSSKLTRFGRKKALGEALMRKKAVKEDVSEEEFLDGMFDKFVANRHVQEGAVLRSLYKVAMQKREENKLKKGKKPTLKEQIQGIKRTHSPFGINK